MGIHIDLNTITNVNDFDKVEKPAGLGKTGLAPVLSVLMRTVKSNYENGDDILTISVDAYNITASKARIEGMQDDDWYIAG